MMHVPLLFCGICAVRRALSQTPSSFFVNPPAAGDEVFFIEDVVFTVGSIVNISWVTDVEAYNIVPWQQSLNGVQSAAEGSSIYTKLLGSGEEGGFAWTVSLGQFSLTQSPVFFLALSPAGQVNLDNATTSHYFNITAAPDITSSAPSSTSTTASTSIAVPTTTTPPPPPSPTESSKSSSSNTAVGVGVGVGFGIPLLLLLFGFLAIPKKYRRRLFTRKPPSYTDSLDRDRHPYADERSERPKSSVRDLQVHELHQSTLGSAGHARSFGPAELDGWQAGPGR